MPQVIVNSGELRRFSALLIETARELRGKSALTSQRFDELKKVWRDAKVKEFEPQFTAATRELEMFVKAAAEYAAYLDEKAARVERYLSR
jgi:hypothetical protein